MSIGSRVPIAFALLASLFIGPTLEAEPYMAIRYGMTCSQCHVNPTGGGKRNRFGMDFSQTTLPSWSINSSDVERFRNLVRPAEPGAAAERGPDEASTTASGESPATKAPRPLIESTYTDGYLADFFSIGADFRFASRTTFPSGPATTSLDLTEGNIYGSLELLDEFATFYLDETVAPGGASAREAFGMLRGPAGSWLKAGRILLPFGTRIQDDAAFIREQTGFNFGSQDLGVELGLEPGPISAAISVSNGTGGSSDDNRDKQVTGMIGFIQRQFRVGVQGSWNNGTEARRAVFGATAGFNIGRLTILAEADEVIDKSFGVDSSVNHEVLYYAEADYLLAKGVNLRFSYDYADPDSGVSSDQFTRIGGGIQYFPVQFTELRLLYYFRDEADRSGRPDTGTLILEAHLFF
jgi:hypothetical protein